MENNLTGKQKLFVEAYLAYGKKSFLNATQSAIEAGYTGSYWAQARRGHENLKHSKIRAYIDARLRDMGYNSDDLIRRWISVAKTDLSPYITQMGLDVEALKEAGLGFLIKGVRKTLHVTNIELRDPEHAEDQLAKALGMFIERREITGGGGGPLRIEYTNDWRNPSTLPTPRPAGDTESSREIQAGDGGPEVAEDDDGDPSGD